MTRLLRCVLGLAICMSAWPQTRVARSPRFQQQPDSQMAGEFTLSGSVVDGSTGEPVRKASVNIRGAGPQSGFGTTLTDASGRFSFAHLEAGPYLVNATKAGYTPASIHAETSVTVNSEHASETVTYKLMRNGTVSGKVLDEVEEPVAFASVQALRKVVVNGRRRWQPAGGTNTNDLGEYRLTMQPGTYLIEATANAQAMMGRGEFHGKHIGTDAPVMTYASMYYPNAKDSASAVPMKIASGEDQRADFRVAPSHAVTISGRVVNLPANHGMGLSLAPADGETSFRRPGAGVNAGDGTFQIPAVLPGRYLLMADMFAPPNEHMSARVPLTVGDSDLADVVVTLAPAFDIPVAVKSDGTNSPVIEVTFNAPDGAQNFQVAGGTTGELILKGMVPGSYQVRVNAHGGGYVKSATLGGADVLGRTIELSAAPGTLDVVLSQDGGSVTGDVSDSDGKPANTQVMLLRRLAGGEMMLARQLHSDESGKFTAKDLAPGDYIAFASDDVSNFEYADAGAARKYQDFVQSVTVQEKTDQKLSLKVATF